MHTYTLFAEEFFSVYVVRNYDQSVIYVCSGFADLRSSWWREGRGVILAGDDRFSHSVDDESFRISVCIIYIRNFKMRVFVFN